MTAATLELTDHQYANALSVIAAVKARGWPIKAAYIATAGGLAEAGLRMLASANVPESQKYPNDGLGYDHASMNFFQQQTGYVWAPANQGVYQPNPTMEMSTMESPDGWGTPAELMNAETATSKFLDALSRVPWQSMTNWAAAQAVQGSAYADGSNYEAQDVRARQIVNALWSEEDDMAFAIQYAYKPNSRTTVIRIADPYLQDVIGFDSPADLNAWKAAFRAGGGTVVTASFSNAYAGQIGAKK